MGLCRWRRVGAQAARVAAPRGKDAAVLVGSPDRDAPVVPWINHPQLVVIAEVFDKKTKSTPGPVIERCKERLRRYDEVLRERKRT